MVEEMLVDKLFLPGPGTSSQYENYRTQATGMKTGNPDSTTGCSPAQDTTECPDEEHISSSYSDVTLEIGGETFVVKGTWRTELITAHMVSLGNNRFMCNYCEFESHNRVKTFAHIGYIHLSSLCETCGHMCFQTCSTQEKAAGPTSSKSPPIVIH